MKTNNATGAAKDEESDDGVEGFEKFLSSKPELSYFKLRDEDKDWSDKLLNFEVEAFHFDELGGMGERPMFIDGDTIFNNYFLRSLLSYKGPDYFMGFVTALISSSIWKAAARTV